MKAIWSMDKGLTIIGQPNQGQPRHWTVKAWASIASGERIEVLVRPKGKVRLAQWQRLYSAFLGSDSPRRMSSARGGVIVMKAGVAMVAGAKNSELKIGSRSRAFGG